MQKNSFFNGFAIGLLLGFISIVFHISSDDEEFKSGLTCGVLVNGLIAVVGCILVLKIIGFI